MPYPPSIRNPGARTLCIALAACIGCLLPAPARAQDAARPGNATSLDLLVLRTSATGKALPSGWTSRAVRGRQLPVSEIVDSADGRFLRLSGAGAAGWFGRELVTPVRAGGGQLSWTWRVPLHPANADVGHPATDDAALRVFVVFARHSRFAPTPRTIFYTVSGGQARARGPRAGPLASIVVADPAATRHWTTVMANPFLDYRRLWGEDPTRIIAFGVMQDTDQTAAPAVGDLRHLLWRTPDAPAP